MFRRLLIANRGEIALRVIRACKRLGIESAAVFSEADRQGPWLRHADKTICIGPARADRSYLDADAILQAAEQLDCQAIHPGYGFLSENAVFAARCEQQGITFVGPGAAAIRRMGNKTAAKRTMEAAGLPTIPGSQDVLADVIEARDLASRIGFPVLLKASAGGGGRGMRRCADSGQLAASYADARREAEAAFGDGSLYLEKLIERARHIEFQILCDAYGNAIHLGERDCSIQRKHQKLIEESPSPAIDPATRESFGAEVADSVARSGYRGAGTVEFLRDEDGRFYFMEMNARLQVEHPVSEMVTGIDLVAEQLRIAANEPLAIEQDDVRISGHAIEFRINAEDPDHDFRPDPGTIDTFTAPGCARDGVDVRWDSVVEAGYKIPPHYDSMIGKLIVHAGDRQGALEAASEALSSLRIGGVATTIAFHQQMLADADFRRGHYDIQTLSGRQETAEEPN